MTRELEVRKARKKPVVIEFIRWNGKGDESGMGLLFKLLGDGELPHASRKFSLQPMRKSSHDPRASV